jgi:hypothetical protein
VPPVSRSVALLSEQLVPLAHCRVCVVVGTVGVGGVCGMGWVCGIGCGGDCGCGCAGACCALAAQASSNAMGNAAIMARGLRFMFALLAVNADEATPVPQRRGGVKCVRLHSWCVAKARNRGRQADGERKVVRRARSCMQARGLPR